MKKKTKFLCFVGIAGYVYISILLKRMKLKLNIKGDIEQYCIACLEKSQNMHNLNKSTPIRLLFSSLFNIEFTNYKECPQFLCYVCDIKLNVTHDFQRTVRKSLAILEEYNKKFKDVKIEHHFNEVESEDKPEFESVNNKDVEDIKSLRDENGEDIELVHDDKFATEDNTISKAKVKVQQIDTSKIEATPIERANEAIEYNEKFKEVEIEHNFNIVVSEDNTEFESVNNEIVEDIESLNDENGEEIELAHNDEFAIEDNTKTKAKFHQRLDASKIEPVPIDRVNQVIKDFRNSLSANKTCVLCGFFAANRRAISSHMAWFHREEKNRWCLDCNNIFENYEEHKRTHSNKYECPFCGKKFNLSHYVEHLQSHAGTFKCRICKKTFKSAGWLSKHVRIHTNDKPYSCPNCSKGFIQLSSLRYHVGKHGKFSCNACKKHYKTEKALRKHECVSSVLELPTEILIETEGANDSSVAEEKIIIKRPEAAGIIDLQNFCKECNKRVKSLNQHNKKYHVPKTIAGKEQTSKVKERQCKFCQKIFSNSYKLRVHTRIHTGIMPYKCAYCDKRTFNKTQLNDHQRTHTKEKPFICNVCGKGLSQASALRTHMRQHTGRPEVCALCDKRFCRKAELRLHLSKHMGEKPFLCTECGKTFAQKSHLTEHMAGHSEVRPFQCLHCEKSFKKKNLLQEHLMIHKGFKPFQCPICSYACYKAYRLQQHMKQHSADFMGQYNLDKPNSDQNCENQLSTEICYEDNVVL